MIKNFISAIILLATSVIILSSNIYPQIIEKDRVFYRNFRLNPDTNNHTDQELILNKNTSGNPIEPPVLKNDFMVNTLDGAYGSDQYSGKVAMDGNGNYAFTWLDKRNEQTEIYAQFFDSNGNRIGSNFKVNEGTLFGNNAPYLAANKTGDFVIAWLQSFSTVVAQRFTNTGQKVGGNIIVNTISGWNTMEPCVAVDNDGSFIIMWALEQGNGIYQVYARLIDSTGTPSGNEKTINDPSNNLSSIGQGKFISIDASGSYYLCWSSYGGTNFSKIYLQRLNRQGNKIGSNIEVSSSQDSSDHYFPEIVTTDDGYSFIIWWKELRNQIKSGASARIYSSDSSFVTDEIIISEPDVFGDYYTTTTDKDSIFLYVSSSSTRPYFQRINKSGQFVGDTVGVGYNLNNINYIQIRDISEIMNDRFIIASDAAQRTDLNIYLQEYDDNLLPVGESKKINDDFAGSRQRFPYVKFNKQGQSIVLWEDGKNGRKDLYAQIYDENFNPVNQNIQINEVSTDYWFLHNKEVQSFSDGTFIIAYTGSDQYYNDMVWLQAVSPSGEKIGNNILVKDKVYDQQYELAINVNSNDELLLCWYYRYGSYLKIFDKNLNPISSVKNFMKYSSTQGFQPYTISVDTNFNVFAAWKNFDFVSYTSGNQIFGEFFDRNGRPGTTPFLIDSTNTYIMKIKCKNDGNENYVLVYKDEYNYYIKRKYHLDKDYEFTDRLESYSYAPTSMNIVQFDNQKVFITYNNSLNVLGFYANDNRHSSEFYYLHQYEYIDTYYDDYNGINSADIYNNKLIFTFESSRNAGTSSDIWANVRTIENINFNKELFFAPVSSDYLYNNYPNPFNPKTKITYQLLAYHNVKLSIYDILGREVKVLVNENQGKGIYEVEFNASGLASGVYFYRLEAFDTTIKKMILLR